MYKYQKISGSEENKECDDYLVNITSRYFRPVRGEFIVVEIVVKTNGLKVRV